MHVDPERHQTRLFVDHRKVPSLDCDVRDGGKRILQGELGFDRRNESEGEDKTQQKKTQQHMHK